MQTTVWKTLEQCKEKQHFNEKSNVNWDQPALVEHPEQRLQLLDTAGVRKVHLRSSQEDCQDNWCASPALDLVHTQRSTSPGVFRGWKTNNNFSNGWNMKSLKNRCQNPLLILSKTIACLHPLAWTHLMVPSSFQFLQKALTQRCPANPPTLVSHPVALWTCVVHKLWMGWNRCQSIYTCVCVREMENETHNIFWPQADDWHLCRLVVHARIHSLGLVTGVSPVDWWLVVPGSFSHSVTWKFLTFCNLEVSHIL